MSTLNIEAKERNISLESQRWFWNFPEYSENAVNSVDFLPKLFLCARNEKFCWQHIRDHEHHSVVNSYNFISPLSHLMAQSWLTQH